jgi:hypothetical protein
MALAFKLGFISSEREALTILDVQRLSSCILSPLSQRTTIQMS